MGSKRKPRRGWTRCSDQRLLEQRLRDLDLRIERTWLQSCVNRLYQELENRGILFRPHVWLSTEWFSPDGIPGIAIPFYLAHPRLMRLERREMLQVEGATEASCMHFKPAWRKAFGRYAQRYPEYYVPKPDSRSYVLHLDSWYAQAHPAEDFAETFAVWLKPRSAWRQRYRDWPKVLRKLRYVEREMSASVVERPARVHSRRQVDPVSRMSQPLGDCYDRVLYRLFSDDSRYRDRPTAASFLRSMRAELRESVAEWTGVHPYTVDQVLQDMMERARELRLRLALSPRRAKTRAVLLLTVHTMNCLYVGRYEIPL